MDQKEEIVRSLNSLIERGVPIAESYSGMVGSLTTTWPEWEIREFVTAASAAIDRIAGRDSQYYRQVVLVPAAHLGSTPEVVMSVVGSLRALRDAVEHGWLATTAELLRAEMSADFLEMADHLLSEGYKDAAAVLASGVLEEHLRRLCDKHKMPTTQGGRPKKAETMNTELGGAVAYSKADQKSVTAWLALRNHAAHAQYDRYGVEQVQILCASIREFVRRVPA